MKSILNISKTTILLVGCAIALSFGTPTQALSADITSAPPAELQPFKPTDAQDNALCKYTYGTTWNGHTGLPPLFQNVVGIYISATSNFYGPEDRTITFLQPDSLALLSACTVAKDTKSHIPVYLPQLSGNPKWKSFLNWPAAREDGNLVVRVSASLQDERSFHHGVLPGKLVVVKALYYRHDVNGLSNLGYQCAQAFRYSKDEDQLHMLLSDALHRCLDEPFFSTSTR